MVNKLSNCHKKVKTHYSFKIIIDKCKYHLLFTPIKEKVQGCTPDNIKSYTNKYQQHTGCSYGCKVVCCYDDKYTKPVKIYRGDEPVKKFMQEMLLKVEYCQKIAAKFKNP